MPARQTASGRGKPAAGRRTSPTGWVLRVGLPSLLLLGLASVVPPEALWARSAAQVCAVLVPLGIEVVRSKWEQSHDHERSREKLRAQLGELGDAVPDGRKIALDTAGYRIAPYWGRSADHRRLDAALTGARPGVILVTGPAWVGKTRLLTEWASRLPPEVVRGWLPPGEAVEVARAARDLGTPVVLLLPGSQSDALAVLMLLAVGNHQVTLAIEVRDTSHFAAAARIDSDAAGRLVDAATEVALESPGTAADLDHRYAEMVVAYSAAASRPSLTGRPRWSRPWTTEPIGLVSALAMMEAIGDRTDTTRRSLLQVFGTYWKTLSEQWLRQRPAPKYGLPALSDVQLETALVLDLLTGGEAAAAFAQLPLLRKLDAHEAEQLHRWSSKVTESIRSARSSRLAAVAATESWTDDQRRDAGAALRAGSRGGLAAAIRECVFAEGQLRERPALTAAVVAPDATSIQGALAALDGEVVTRPIDILLAEQVGLADLTLDEVEELLADPLLERARRTRLALTRYRFDHLPKNQSPASRAELAIHLSIMYRSFGRNRDALTLAEAAVAIRLNQYAPVAPADRSQYDTDLAIALNNLSYVLANLGRHQESLDHAKEVVAIERRLADPEGGNPDLHTPALAVALNNLSAGFSEVGRTQEALSAAFEAVRLQSQLADPRTGSHDRYKPLLALTLGNLANRLIQLGRYEEALAAAKVAVLLGRQLTDPSTGDPNRFDPDLAVWLATLSRALSDLGRHRDALPPAAEAVRISRRLADPDSGNPDLHNPDLALSLVDMFVRLRRLGRRAEALASAEEALSLYRRLANPDTGNPDRFNADLALALVNLHAALSDLGRVKEALPLAEESASIYQQLADADSSPNRYDPGLALSLHNLASALGVLGRYQEALSSARASVVIWRRVAAPGTGIPARYGPDLASSLESVARQLAALGRHQDALAPAAEAVDLLRAAAHPVSGLPDRHDADLADSLGSLADRLSELGRYQEALEPAGQSVSLYRHLADPETGSPTGFGALLRTSERRLKELRLRLADLDRSDLSG